MRKKIDHFEKVNKAKSILQTRQKSTQKKTEIIIKNENIPYLINWLQWASNQKGASCH